MRSAAHVLRAGAFASRPWARTSASVASLEAEQTLSAAGERFRKFAQVNESAFKVVGGVFLTVVGGVAWAGNIRMNLHLASEKATAASALASEKATAASALASEKATAASALAVKDAELRMERRIFDYAFHGDYDKMRAVRDDVLAKMPVKVVDVPAEVPKVAADVRVETPGAAASNSCGSGGPAGAPLPP